MLDYDFEESVGYWVCMSAHAFQREMNDQLAPHGITYRQCQVLGWLALSGPLSQKDLAEKMHIEPPTLVGILDRMERDRWIEREPCADDRRKKVIRPTRDAEPIWSTIVACARKVRERAVEGMTAEQIATLKELLAIMRQNLAVPGEPTVGLVPHDAGRMG